MTLREVTIGRAKDCDIFLDERCIYASSHHATIYYDSNQLMYRDWSSNGTMINNVSVKHRAVPIHRGDIIMIAGKYQINWNQIDAFFPPRSQAMSQPQQQRQAVQQQQPMVGAPNTSKWSWGAFMLYPIWGFFNGCWWAFFIGMFAGWLFPIPNIIFGVYGNRWSWENKTWSSASDFESTQHSWDIAGIIILAINIIAILCVFFFYAALLSAFF